MHADLATQGSDTERYPELDLLRGIAIVLMVSYHLLFDLAYFWQWDVDVQGGGLALTAKGTAALFLLLFGICFSISWSRTPQRLRLRKALRRAGILLLGAMLITTITRLFFPQEFVLFGILHLLGVSAVVTPFLFRLHRWNALVGIMLIALPAALPSTCVRCNPLLLPLGIHDASFASLDYYPFLPWFGVVCIGMAVGSALYLPQRTQALAALKRRNYPSILLWAGKRSLLIYFLHQPILLALLSLTEKLIKLAAIH